MSTVAAAGQEVSVRPLAVEDLPALPPIHLAAFRDSALAALGPVAIRRYYEWQLTGPHEAGAFGGCLGDELAGFCFGGVFRGAMSGFLRKNRPLLVRQVLTHPWLIANPIFRERLGMAARLLSRRARRSPIAPEAAGRPASYGILAIAVHPDAQGLGLGKLLMLRSERAARERGFGQMHLTVNPQNTPAVRFYEGLGWERVLQGERWTGRMEKRLL